MDNIKIQRVTSENYIHFINGLVHVFRDDTSAWHWHENCLLWLKKRSERGFYMTVAFINEKIVGYSEWIKSFDDNKKTMYLGTMHVDGEFRGMGIGTALLSDGESYAINNGVEIIRAMPEDERAWDSYRKYGYYETDIFYTCDCPTVQGNAVYTESAEITPETLGKKQFIFGLLHPSNNYIYERVNHNPAPEEHIIITAYIPDGYLQFDRFEGETDATVYYWSDKDADAQTISTILSLGYKLGYNKLTFVFRSKYKNLFADYDVNYDNTEISKLITT